MQSELLYLTLTVGLYCLATALHRRTRIALLHPVLVTFLVLILLLRGAGVDYAAYREATRLLDFGLGLAVVALGYLMYEQLDRMRGRLLPILVSTAVGCVVGVLSTVYIARAFGVGRAVLTSLAPKSVTVPIAVSIVEPLGGIVPLTAVVVFCVGVFGSIVGERLLRLCGVHDPMARGFAMGSAAHGVGTARAIEMGAVEGALSGLAMALMGVTTALLLPLLERWCY